MTHRSIRDVLNDIDSYLGLPPAPESAAAGSSATQAAQAAERNRTTLHLMYDTERKTLIGCSMNGKLFMGVVSAQLKDGVGVSLLNRDGEDLLDAKAGVPEQRSQAAAPARVEADIYNWMTSGGSDE